MYPLHHVHLNIPAREENVLGAVVVDDTEVVGAKGEGYIPHYILWTLDIIYMWDSANGF